MSTDTTTDTPKVVGWVKTSPASFHLAPAVLTVCQKAAAKRSVSIELWLAEAIWMALVEEHELSTPET